MNRLARVRTIADRWVEMHQRTAPDTSLKTLGSRAADNSMLFDRTDMKVSTFDRLVSFLGSPQNWPLALVPNDVADALGELGESVDDDARLPVDALVA